MNTTRFLRSLDNREANGDTALISIIAGRRPRHRDTAGNRGRPEHTGSRHGLNPISGHGLINLTNRLPQRPAHEVLIRRGELPQKQATNDFLICSGEVALIEFNALEPSQVNDKNLHRKLYLRAENKCPSLFSAVAENRRLTWFLYASSP